jgi:hypothetical protein
MIKLKLIAHFLLVIAVGLLLGCQKNSSTSNNLDENLLSLKDGASTNIIIDETEFNSTNSDPYTISNACVESGSLKLTVCYRGGCGTARFDLLTNGVFMESNPVQLDVLLSFADNDPCEKIIQRKLSFDLSNLAEHYYTNYLIENGVVVLRLKNYSGYLEYSFN